MVLCGALGECDWVWCVFGCRGRCSDWNNTGVHVAARVYYYTYMFYARLNSHNVTVLRARSKKTFRSTTIDLPHNIGTVDRGASVCFFVPLVVWVSWTRVSICGILFLQTGVHQWTRNGSSWARTQVQQGNISDVHARSSIYVSMESYIYMRRRWMDRGCI